MNTRRVVSALALTLFVTGCGGSETRAPKSAVCAPSLSPPARLYLDDPKPVDLDDLQFVGLEDGPVPDFELRTPRGRLLRSDQLVGERPFLVVFFATWCDACEKTLPALKRTLDRVGDITVIGVSADETTDWSRVEGYLNQFGLDFPVVKASSYPRFWFSYNYFKALPLVVVVGKNGGLVDYQVGYEPSYEPRLAGAVQLARTIGPLADPDDS